MARPRKEDAVDISRRAIEETIRLLETRGDVDVPLTEVADAVGCRAPAFYGYYRNKNALLRAVHDEGFARLYGEKLAVASRTKHDAFERLRQGGYAYLRFALENPVLYRLMFTPPDIPNMAGDPFETDIGRRALGFLAESIRACQEDGYLQGADPQAYAFTLWSAVHGAASLVLQNRGPSVEDRQATAFSVVDHLMVLVAASRSDRRPI